MNIVQQILYGQGVRDLLECQEVSTTSGLRTLHLFIADEGVRALPRGGTGASANDAPASPEERETVMKPVKEMTRLELACYIGSEFKRRGISVVLSGGSAVSIYSSELYVSIDWDDV